jgi:glycosyltransferase involved in cell wall biosynthesis
MRILHIILSTDFAGSEAHCCWLASEQARAGHDVAVLVRDGAAGYLARIRREAAPAAVLLLPRWLPGLLESLGCGMAARAFRPDVIHAHLGRAAQRTMRPASRVPLVATLHIDWRRQYLRCDGVICIAGWQKAAIPPAFKGRIEVIWNSTPPGAVRTHARRGDAVDFLSVGRLVPNKGMDVLIRAFRAAFPDRSAPVTLTIAGDGPERASLEALAAGDPRITLVGYVDDVAQLYPKAHVYVSAARIEPFGLTILEAMQAQCQVICTRTAGPQEFLAAQPPDWVAVDDVDSLAAALRLRAVPSVAPRVWDMAPFSPQLAAEQIMRFYGECIADRASRAR